MENEKPILVAKNEYGLAFWGLFSTALGIFIIYSCREEGYVQFSYSGFSVGLLFLFLGVLLTIMILTFPKSKISFYNDRLEVNKPEEKNQILYYKNIECWKEYNFEKYPGIEIYTNDRLLIIKNGEHNNISKIKKLLIGLGLPYNADIEKANRIKIDTDKAYPNWIAGTSIALIICLFFSTFTFISVKRKNDKAISTEKIIFNATLSEDSYISLRSRPKSSRVDTSVELQIENTDIVFETDANILSVEQLSYIYNQLHKDEKVSLQILKVDYEYRIAKTKKPTVWYNHLRLGNIHIYGLQHKDNILIPLEK